jgi:adenylate kinase family enzyme
MGMYKKIAIIGCAGSGKTTLALQLKEKLNLPLYHLDQYYWKPQWERTDAETFARAHRELCNQESWIIEGTNTSLLPVRAEAADCIIFLDVPRMTCLFRVLKRSFTHRGEEIEGSPKGCVQRIMSRKYLEFLRWIWNYQAHKRPEILAILKQYPHKSIYIVRSVDEFLCTIF